MAVRVFYNNLMLMHPVDRDIVSVDFLLATGCGWWLGPAVMVRRENARQLGGGTEIIFGQ